MKFLRMYRARTNAMNLYVIEDTYTGLYIVADWNLSEDAEKELIQRFEAGEITGEENDGRWESEEKAFGETFNRECIGVYDDKMQKYEIGLITESGNFFTLYEDGLETGYPLTVEVPRTATLEEIKQEFATKYGICKEFLDQCNQARATT